MKRFKVNDMTRDEFLALPARAWAEPVAPFDALVILPLDEMHESGYRLMDFVAVRDGEAVCRLSGCSDVLHIGGIGSAWPDSPRRGRSWSIDCLPGSGLLCIWDSVSGAHALTVGAALSSFELFSKGAP